MSEEHNQKGRSLYYQRFSAQQMPSGGPAYATPAYAAPVYGDAGGYGGDPLEGVGGRAVRRGRLIRGCANHLPFIHL